MSEERDERFEAFLQREVAEYNQPPQELPREEMWEVIARTRAAARGAGGAARSDATHRRPLRYAPWIGMAATLLIGIGVGRFLMQRERPADLARESAAPVIETPTVEPAAPAGSGTPATERAERRVLSARAVALVAGPGVGPGVGPRAGPRAPEAFAAGPRNAAYQQASRDHLARAEALVAVVAAMPADALMDSLMGHWARDVLTNTRLLLDSPAGEDPIRRRLLEDLETLLVQLVQRSGRAVEERDLIDRTLLRTQLLTRLRSGTTGT